MRKKSPIVIEKLTGDWAHELKLMQTELEAEPPRDRDNLKPRRWSRRFAASGKIHKTNAPKIRTSYEA